MRRRVIVAIFVVAVGLGNGLVLGQTLASSGRAARSTTSSTVVTRTCVPLLPTGRLCKTVRRIGPTKVSQSTDRKSIDLVR
jgi:hypothetical protein